MIKVELDASDARKLRLAADWVEGTPPPAGALSDLGDADLVAAEVAARLRAIADEVWPEKLG